MLAPAPQAKPGDCSNAQACHSEPSHALQPPEHFPFPYTPYAIQEDFMRQLFQVLEGGGLGIFESPTGTVCTKDNIKPLAVTLKSYYS